MANYDLVLGPNCWRMNGVLMHHLDVAIRAARLLRYPAKDKETLKQKAAKAGKGTGTRKRKPKGAASEVPAEGPSAVDTATNSATDTASDGGQ